MQYLSNADKDALKKATEALTKVVAALDNPFVDVGKVIREALRIAGILEMRFGGRLDGDAGLEVRVLKVPKDEPKATES